jgi:curved DNA-binding protein CbpA
VLGVASTASLREIRDAYRARARMAHPDLTGDASASWMRDLNAAWDVLKNPDRRAAYDALLNGPVSDRKATGTAAPIDEREPWKGAAGAPPGRPIGPVLDFGIYAGWSLTQVARRDPGYVAWLKDRPEARAHADEIGRIVKALQGAQDPDAAKRDAKAGKRGRFQRG